MPAAVAAIVAIHVETEVPADLLDATVRDETHHALAIYTARHAWLRLSGGPDV